VQRAFYGEANGENRSMPDIDFRERLALVPLVVLAVAMGISSPYWMKSIDPAAAKVNSARTANVMAYEAQK
jgi:NADH-quinone oxidoreductase subunit M